MTQQAETEQYVIIIGAMKSGSTTLFSMLAKHPQIAAATYKEPGFFAFEDVYAQGFDWYHSLFDFDPARHRYRLEASTDYTKAPFVTGVRARMQARPQARYKFIYIMRHPLRRIESHSRHAQMKNREIGQQLMTRSSNSLDNGLSLASLAMTRYADQLDVYADAHAAGDLFITTLEELKAAPDTVLSGIWQFLDLPKPAAVAEAAWVNSGSKKVVLHDSWTRLSRSRALMGLGKLLLPRGLRDRIKDLFRRDVAQEGRYKLTPVEEAALIAQLAPDLAALHSRYGVDVAGIWGLPDGTVDEGQDRAATGPGLCSNRV